MRGIAILLTISSLSACGGSPTGPLLDLAARSSQSTVAPTASTGFARASDSITNVKPGTAFTMSAREISVLDNDLTVNPFDTTQLKGTFTSPTELELELNGKTYTLSYDAADDSFNGQDADREVSVLLSPQNRYAGMATVMLSQASRFTTQGSIFTGVIGYSTDPNRLPSSASYKGSASLSAIPEVGALDRASGAVNMNANFRDGTVSGTIALLDPTGDTLGPVDLGNMTITFDHPYRSSPITAPATVNAGTPTTTGGVIDGNTFTAALGIPIGDLVDAGIFGDPNLTLNGGFYGPTGEHAVGIATGSGRTVGSTGQQDVLLNLSVNAAKQ